MELQDGRAVLRVQTAASYGNLLHRLDIVAAGGL